MKRFYSNWLLFTIFVVINSCIRTEPGVPLRIAVSRATPLENYKNYYRWLKSVDSTIIIIDMYHLSLDSALAVLDKCDGLLLTGGPDVYPGRFGKEGDTSRCTEIDVKRDTLEFALLKRSQDKKMPVQAVCRGLQVINVYFGGSLVIDIPTDLDTIVKHQKPDTYECYHEVEVSHGSELYILCGTEKVKVNSNHHQGIEVLSQDLIGMASTSDGLIEAIGLKEPEPNQYFLAVQWHPERLDYSNPLSGPIIQKFIDSAKSFQRKIK
jgi:putative glutamine amidotransferase